MKTYVINLDRNPERLEFIREQLERIDVPFERISAVYGKALSPAEMRERFSRLRSFVASKKRMSASEIGCALSHVKIYRKLIEENVPVALVLEDDAVLGPEFAANLREAAAFLDPARPQVLLFSGHGIAGADERRGIVSIESAWCTDAYCVTQAAAKLILKANFPVITVADSFKRWHRRFGLELYRAFPIAVRQEDVAFGSNIQILPKSNFLVRNLMWLADWVLWKVTGR